MTLAGFPTWRDRINNWQTVLANTEWTPWLIIGLAAFLRFFLLDIKPPHFDEGINGWFVDQMTKNGYYTYDPTNYHGPLHFYVLFLSQTLFGRNLWALRLPVVLVSITCVWLTLKYEPFVGRTVSRLAALAMAVSTGFVFYGRYSIHEVWLLFFSMAFIFGLLGLWKSGTANYLWWTGIGLTGMVLTKETYIIHLGCAIIAAGVCYGSTFLSRIPYARPARQTWNYYDLSFVIAVSVALIIIFYSGTFYNLPEFSAAGMKEFWNTFTKVFRTWFATGQEGHGHEKPWDYWLKLMWRYEWPASFGLILSLGALRLKNVSLRYMAIYAVGTLMAYSIVSYKTPWCIISFIWPFLFIFGAATLIFPPLFQRGLQVISAVLLCVSLGSSIWLNYFRCTTDTEPYVYVQTYNEINRFTEPVVTLAKRDPIYYQMTGHIIRGSSYPLPWILDDFPNIGYYEHDNSPTNFDADFLLVQQDRIQEVEAKLQNSYYTTTITIRPYQDTSRVYFNAKRFKDFFPGRVPDFAGKGQG